MISPFPSIMLYYNSMKTKTITPDQFIQGNYMNKLDFLSDVLEDFCDKHNLPFMSADDLLYAHVYVRYLGDLKGGQMIASRVPGKRLYYKFDEPEILESLIRERLRGDEEFVEECKKCFTFATKSFEDIKDYIDKNM